MLQQISVGGCFTDWEECLFPGDEFRLELPLPNGNRLPLRCKVIYRFEDSGIGVKFTDVSRFEQQLVASVIVGEMEKDGLPVIPDPFQPPTATFEASSAVPAAKQIKEEKLEKVMSGDE